VLFGPSWVTLILFLLSCATFAWLALRHQPWHIAAILPCDYVDSPHRRFEIYATFTPDGLLLFDSTHGACLYDPATGSLLRTILPTIDRERYHYYAFTGSRHILAFPNENAGSGAPAARLFDFEGKQVARFPNLGRNDNQVVISPVSPTVLYRDRRHVRLPLIARDLTGASKEVRLYRPDVPHSDWRLEDARISPDGTRALVTHWAFPGGPTSHLHVFDLRTGETLAESLRTIDFSEPGADHGFLSPDEIWIATGIRGRKATVEVCAVDGSGLRHVTISGGNMIRDVVVSDDGMLVASSDLRLPGAVIEIRDTHTGNILATRPTFMAITSFFPRSHRFLAGHPSARQLVVADPYHDQPLAVLPGEPSFAFFPHSVISPDGRTVVACIDPNRRKLAIYSKTGPDCPESHLGALALPHVWLLSILLTATVGTAARDARRAKVDTSLPPPSFVPNALILLSLLPTLHFLLAAALGRWTLNPAPAILLAAIGLLTHSRFWRLGCLVILAVTVGWCLYLLNTLRLAGIAGSSSWLVLDREYPIPRVLPTTGLALTILVCMTALYLLIRRRQFMTHAV
jgi:hypothetical protein